MYHICPAGNNQFLVVLLNEKNREVLSTSELLNSKQKAWGSVTAQLKETQNMFYYAQDDTLKNPKVYVLDDGDGKSPSEREPTARYVVKGRRTKKRIV
jgi:uncharacterized protein YegP (UPF0339 family)